MKAADFYHQNRRKGLIVILALLLLLVLFFFLSAFVGTGRLTPKESFLGIFGKGENVNVRIMQKIRIPRVLAGLIAGAALGISGLIMQSVLHNPLASPSTLGVSNAAVFGANLAIIVFSGKSAFQNNPYLLTLFSFVLSVLSIFFILFLAQFRGFSPETVILAGLGMGALFTAMTTIVQYFAQDQDLSEAVYWTFGDLSRASYKEDLIMLSVLVVSYLVFTYFSYSYNALLSGDDTAVSLGVNLKLVRFLSLFLASLLTAVSIAFLGIIGFLGIIAPHIMKRVVGLDHKILLPTTALFGSIVLLFSDTISRLVIRDTSLPVGAVTAILGVPVFLFIIFQRKEGKER